MGVILWFGGFRVIGFGSGLEVVVRGGKGYLGIVFLSG